MKWPWYLLVTALLAAPAKAEPYTESSIRVPECVAVRGVARSQEGGFDHVVYVYNGCPVSIDCNVSTTRDPEPSQHLVVPAGQEKGIVARTKARRPNFEPNVSCKRRARAETSGVHEA